MKKNINRRAFLKDSALAGLAGMTVASAAAGILPTELKNRKPLEDSVNSSSKGEAGPSGTKLSFKKDGTFKIVQFTDTHYIAGDPRSERALKNVSQMLELEKPDLVIHTGDVIYGKPAEESMRQILEPISSKKIPFAVTFGNHDAEYDKTREELYDIIKSIPYSLTSTTKGIYGVTNYVLTLASSKGDKINRVFYLFDSNSYSTLKDFKGYGHIHFDQIAWYRQQSQYFTKMNGETPIPSLAFFHIPLPEHRTAVDDGENGVMSGTRAENVSSPNVNSGLFVSMKEMGDIQAMFVGHDHDNDCTTHWHNIFFVYGRFSGCDTVYNDLKPNGARVIELTEGKDGFRSWIRLYGGEMIQNAQYPDDFLGK